LFNKEILIDLIKKSRILIGNKHEIDQIITKTGLNLEELIQHIDAIITTKGPEGSELIYKDNSNNIFKIEIPIATPKKIEDTTGAGDGYRAGILTGLSLNMTLIDSCRLGTIVGSFVVETTGAQTQNFNIQEVRKRFFNTFNYLPNELESV
ncbi:MAG: PfkB family carbohydrate kinase, partial [Promethearchaeota archaeon]